jgi:signal transduction histidine kinase
MSEDGSSASPNKSDPKKDAARGLWDRLRKSRPGPDNKELIYLARFVPLLSTVAAKTLLTRKLNIEELKELIQHVPKAQEAATQLALKNAADSISEDDLRFILSQTKSVDVAKILLKQYPNDANLSLVERSVDTLNDSVEKIRQLEPTKTVLREIDRKL